jgi:multiple sugar transport system substrate-binding protein
MATGEFSQTPWRYRRKVLSNKTFEEEFKMSRNTLFSILSLVIVLSMLAGCGAAPEPEVIIQTVEVEKEVIKEVEKIVTQVVEVEKEVIVEVTPSPEFMEDVTLVYWSDPRFTLVKGKEDQTQVVGDYEMLLAEQFMEMHPNVTIEVEALQWADLSTKVTAAIAAGAPPDILKDYLGRTSGYAWQGLLEPMEELVPTEELADYLPDLIAQYTIDGHLHGLPLFYWITAMAGNKAIWDAAGATDLLPLDDGEWTFEEFEAALAAVQKPEEIWPLGLQVASEQGDYMYLAYPWGMGATLYPPGDYSVSALNSPEGVAGVQKMIDYVNADYVEPGATTITSQDMLTMFFSGQSAIKGESLGIKQSLDKAILEGTLTTEMDLFFTMFPHAEGVKTGAMAAGPTGAVVFKQDDPAKRYWAVQFARFLASPELQREYAVNARQFPSRKSVGTPLAGDPDYEKMLSWVKEYGLSDMGLASPNYYEMRVQLYPHLQAAMLGDKTAEEALADYEAAANEVLSR